jgi:hypothetical protein
MDQKQTHFDKYLQKHAERVKPYTFDEMDDIRLKMKKSGLFTTEERTRLYAVLFEYVGLYENRERVWRQSQKGLAELLRDAADAISDAY